MSSRKYIEERRQKRNRQTRYLTMMMAGGVIMVLAAVIYASVTSSNVNIRSRQIEQPEFTTLEQFDLSGLGNPQAPVIIEEYSSFGCGHCGDFALETKKLLEEEYISTGQVAIIFRALEYLEGSTAIQQAVEAVYCAGEQGQFWNYHDLLFANQARLFSNRAANISKTVETFSELLDLNQSDFEACLTDGKYRQLVIENQASAQELGISGTPTFVVNGVLLRGNQPYENFQIAIENALAAGN